jgi:hypothetical protein
MGRIENLRFENLKFSKFCVALGRSNFKFSNFQFQISSRGART